MQRIILLLGLMAPAVIFGSDSKESATQQIIDDNIKLFESIASRGQQSIALGAEPTLISLKGHTSAIFAIAYSPDGKSIFTGSSDETARLWNITDLNNLTFKELKGHAGVITSVAFSPDGKSVLTGSYDATARLWDVASCKTTSSTPSSSSSQPSSSDNKDEKASSSSKSSLKEANNKKLIAAVLERNINKTNEILMAGNVDINSLGKKGFNALHYAANKCNLDMVALLFKCYADVNIGDKYGHTAMHRAAAGNYCAMLEKLIDDKNRPNFGIKDRKGRTPLHWASIKGSVDSAKLLLKKMNRDQVNIEDNNKKTALVYADQGIKKFPLRGKRCETIWWDIKAKQNL